MRVASRTLPLRCTVYTRGVQESVRCCLPHAARTAASCQRSRRETTFCLIDYMFVSFLVDTVVWQDVARRICTRSCSVGLSTRFAELLSVLRTGQYLFSPPPAGRCLWGQTTKRNRRRECSGKNFRVRVVLYPRGKWAFYSVRKLPDCALLLVIFLLLTLLLEWTRPSLYERELDARRANTPGHVAQAERESAWLCVDVAPLLLLFGNAGEDLLRSVFNRERIEQGGKACC